MEQRCEIIMTGVGGKGVLMAGRLLAQAAMSLDKQVVWLPSYSAAKRGGPCDCSILISDDRIPSPVISKADAIIVMDPSQLESFEGRLKSGGTLITESAGLKRRVSRDDITVLTIPAVQEAVGLGDSRVANLILLGTYLEMTKIIPLDAIERELEKTFGSKEDMLTLNREAFKRGVNIGNQSSQYTLQQDSKQTTQGEIVIDEKHCRGCGYCAHFCPRGCITVPGDKFTPEGYMLPVFSNSEKCTACGICSWMCPCFSIEVYKIED